MNKKIFVTILAVLFLLSSDMQAIKKYGGFQEHPCKNFTVGKHYNSLNGTTNIGFFLASDNKLLFSRQTKKGLVKDLVWSPTCASRLILTTFYGGVEVWEIDFFQQSVKVLWDIKKQYEGEGNFMVRWHPTNKNIFVSLWKPRDSSTSEIKASDIKECSSVKTSQEDVNTFYWSGEDDNVLTLDQGAEFTQLSSGQTQVHRLLIKWDIIYNTIKITGRYEYDTFE